MRQAGDRERPICRACGFVYYLNPTVAAGALVEEGGRVVLVRRKAHPRAGYWGLPAGYVEVDESAEDAAIRGPVVEVPASQRRAAERAGGLAALGDPPRPADLTAPRVGRHEAVPEGLDQVSLRQDGPGALEGPHASHGPDPQILLRQVQPGPRRGPGEAHRRVLGLGLDPLAQQASSH